MIFTALDTVTAPVVAFPMFDKSVAAMVELVFANAASLTVTIALAAATFVASVTKAAVNCD